MKKRLAGVTAIILFSCLLLSSCSDGKKASTTDTTVAVTADTTAAETDPREAYTSPEVKDFDGYQFRMLSLDNLVFKQAEYFAEEQNGDPINDALYLRNRAIEDRYNVSIVFNTSDSVMNTIKNSVQAGDDICDIFMDAATSEVFSLAQQGYLYDLKTISTLNLEMPWWGTRIQEGFDIKGKLFCISGDFTIRDKLREMSVLYGKKLYQQYGFEEPYSLVTSGKWTFDVMGGMIKEVTRDLNGDTKLDRFDQWGLMTENIAGWYLYLGSGNKTLHRTGDEYSVDIGGEKVYAIFDKIFEIVANKDIAIAMDDGKVTTELSSVWEEATRMFSNNQVLFRTGTFGDTVDLRNMQSDFGVLPIPKYDESQDGYYCMVSGDTRPIAIPLTVTNVERTGLLLEALSYESVFTLRPAFYETFLEEKVLRDEQSKEMIDILFASQVYDLDYINNITGLSSIVTDIVKTGNNNLSSKTAAVEKAASAKLEKFLKQFED